MVLPHHHHSERIYPVEHIMSLTEALIIGTNLAVVVASFVLARVTLKDAEKDAQRRDSLLRMIVRTLLRSSSDGPRGRHE